MSDLKQYLDVLKEREFSLTLLSLFLLVSPGFLVIFHFFNSEFLVMDTFKLIFLSISIICPAVFAFWLLASNEIYENETSGERSFLSLVTSIIFSGTIVLICLGVSYVVRYPVRNFAYLLVCGIFFGLIFVHILEKNERKKS